MRRIFASLTLTVFAFLFFPWPVLAGSCQCLDVNINDTSAQIQTCSFPSGATSQQDCSVHNNTTVNSSMLSECIYYIGNNCTGDNSTKDLISQNVTCTSDNDCGAKALFAGIAKCINQKCWFDNRALQAFQNGTVLGRTVNFTKPKLNISIPYVDFSKASLDADGFVNIPYLAEYFVGGYKFAVTAASMIAVIVIILNGFRITMSGGGEDRNTGIQNITKAITGLFILWSSYALLYTINPDLVQFKILKVQYIKPLPNIDVIKESLASGTTETGRNGVPIFKQYDSQWGANIYGSLEKVCDPVADSVETTKESTVCCTNIQAAGCGPTSLAMVLASYGITVSPAETAKFAGQPDFGRICNIGTNIGLTISKLDQSPWPTFSGASVSKAKAYELLASGSPIIFLCKQCTGQKNDGTTRTYGGHYMVLTQIDANGLVSVNDPAGTSATAIVNMTDAQLENNAGFWYVHK
ncbi:MAG: C39 family peptidase [Patescibacteria group bacterium]|jgi:hypothetical protein